MKSLRKTAIIMAIMMMASQVAFADAKLNKEIAALELELVKMNTRTGEYADMSDAKLEKCKEKTKKELEKKKAKAKKEAEKEFGKAKEDIKDAAKDVGEAAKDAGKSIKEAGKSVGNAFKNVFGDSDKEDIGDSQEI